MLTFSARAQVEPGAEPLEILRIGFSATVFEGINRNDAQASMKVWADTIVAGSGIAIDPELLVLESPAKMVAAIREQRIEGLTLPSDEFWEICQHITPGQITAGTTQGTITEDYLLLVNRTKGIKSLHQLRDQPLRVWKSPRNSIALKWLEAELLENGLGNLDTFFSSIDHNAKMAQTALPVFFGQPGAALVTRAAFDIMCELNPQLGRTLDAIVVSPPLVPSVFFFRRDYHSANLNRMIEMVAHVNDTPTGAQTLELFQQESILPCDITDLQETLTLFERLAELKKRPPAVATTATNP
ncbi:PhnD/SsuA/transferrin family substrate-binding protein [Synoicihabitans lomoniglobus]|uniref:PhnD/SsuA/transferrin family substrate-binding protein n=1 Tax=Synoicihabitans lomoniglobus TaxID=2909285 RepID=A0AAE9ZZA8_9BACT|nr:PhnD/SsuA/transferrin family substrate-binding protein [Opitutaceae bacterium LMO-M01]WED63262.1 PhnD/SsuA/transferrin family substrate-binding protein [Opitutaceae bacterium LMO-M01]